MSASPAATLRAPQKLLACFMSFLMAAHGLSCDYEDPRCNLDNPSQCGSDPDIGSCTYGYVLTACGCCACGKGLGEACGGQDNTKGVCGTGLQCVVNTDHLPPDLVPLLGSQIPGVCSLATTPSGTQLVALKDADYACCTASKSMLTCVGSSIMLQTASRMVDVYSHQQILEWVYYP